MDKITNTMREVVVANRILAREEVVDAYGHVSIRNPENPERYLMSRSRSPELVTLGDIMDFTLDGEAISDDRTPYAERHIHGAIYEARPEVNSVVHNHSHAVIPFGVTRRFPSRSHMSVRQSERNCQSGISAGISAIRICWSSIWNRAGILPKGLAITMSS